jgi:amidophosphoribosyltransferase
VINAGDLRTELEKTWNVEFDASSDSEVIAELYAKAPGTNWFERSAYCMRKLRGAYSLVMCTERELIAVRDPLGIRPLCLGKLNGGWVVASESAALGNIGAEYVRDIENGETVVINESGVHSKVWAGARKTHSLCVFEQIYFARPDSILDGKLAYESRMRMGAQLSKEHPVDADLVIGVPDSATAAAVGYAQQSGIPYGEGLVRNRYVGRTFIQPDQRMRDIGVRSKFNALPGVIGGKRLIVVDDSIVRGTTTPRVVKMLREAGAAEVHLRISSPPIISTCHFGVDMATMRELVAANHDIESIRKMIGADSLGYLSVEGLMNSVGATPGSYCNGCFTGRYPIPVQLEMNKLELETPAIVR